MAASWLGARSASMPLPLKSALMCFSCGGADGDESSLSSSQEKLGKLDKHSGGGSGDAEGRGSSAEVRGGHGAGDSIAITPVTIRRSITREEHPLIRTIQSMTPRRANSLEALQDREGCVTPLALHFHTTDEPFVNASGLSSRTPDVHKTVRMEIDRNRLSPANESSGSLSGEVPLEQAAAWGTGRRELESKIAKELTRQLTPDHARFFTDSSKGRLSRRLGRLRLSEVHMQGDGNCQFRAISHQLFGTQELHGMVRETCVDYLRMHKKTYEDFVGKSQFEAYVQNMSNDGVWGDEMTLCALSNAFTCIVNVITSEKHNWYLQYWPRSACQKGSDCHEMAEIFLAYTFPLHYDAISGEGISKVL